VPAAEPAAAAPGGAKSHSGLAADPTYRVRVTHLVWDWNGTLLDDLALVVAATNASLALAGGPPITAEEHRRDFRRPIEAYYAGVLGRPLGADEFVGLDRTFHDAYDAGFASIALADGALDALQSWVGTQSLLSMWFHDQLVPAVDRHGLARHFRRVDGLRAEVGGGHKAPHLAAHLAAMGVDGVDCVMIGDSLDDALAAASVGARCVLYSGGFTDAVRLAEVGVPVVDSLIEAVAIAAATESARA
jgi:phosphoglycolate phosphatase-like HAD superfamily hydrolase